jgi:hypothetical protein
LLLAMSSQIALAEAKYGMAGCGLGAMAFGDKNQVFAATTNVTGVAGFAISSGTSNCVEDPNMAAVRAQEKFFADNLKVLSKEMAQGDGEYVKALASTMGCKGSAQGAFGAEMQRSYGQIFSAPGSNAMLGRVRTLIHENRELNSNCNTII